MQRGKKTDDGDNTESYASFFKLIQISAYALSIDITGALKGTLEIEILFFVFRF